MSYVAMVARNHIIDQLRRMPAATDEIDPNIVDPTEDAETTLLASQLAGCIKRARQSLSAPHRKLIELRHDGDLKLREVAEVLGRPINYIASTLARAERYLRQEIRKVCGDHLERVPWIWND
jgi:RNA polymerase sigma factor (sigma-70 family)